MSPCQDHLVLAVVVYKYKHAINKPCWSFLCLSVCSKDTRVGAVCLSALSLNTDVVVLVQSSWLAFMFNQPLLCVV